MEETENNLIIQEIHPIFSKKRSQEKVEKRNGDGMHRDGSGLLDVVVNRGLLEEVVVDPSPEATSMRGRKQPQLPRWSQHPVKGPEAEISLSYSRKRKKTSGQDGKTEEKMADQHGELCPFSNAVSYTHLVS